MKEHLIMAISRSMKWKDALQIVMVGHVLEAAYKNYRMAWEQALKDRDFLQCLCDLSELGRVINAYAKDHLVSNDKVCQFVMGRFIWMIRETGYDPSKLLVLLKTVPAHTPGLSVETR